MGICGWLQHLEVLVVTMVQQIGCERTSMASSEIVRVLWFGNHYSAGCHFLPPLAARDKRVRVSNFDASQFPDRESQIGSEENRFWQN